MKHCFSFRKQMAFFCVVLLIALLSSCASMPTTSRNTSNSTQTSNPESSSHSQGSTGNLSLVTSAVEYSIKGNANENGYYYVERGSDLAANMRYIDFSSGQDIFLSSKPEGNHYISEDESYISSVAGSGVIFPVHESLFLVRTGAPSYANQYGKEALSAIFKMELNGSNRQLLYSGTGNEIILSTIAADENNLFFISCRTETKNSITTENRYLVQMNTKTGELQDLCQLTNSAWMIGAVNNTIVFHSVFVENEDDDAPPVMTHEISTYAFSTQELSVIQSWPNEERTVAAVSNEYLVTANTSTKKLMVQEIATGAVTATHSIDEYISKDNSEMFFADCRNSKFVFWDFEKEQLCAIDILTGAGSYISLKFMEPEKQENRPVEIYAETSSSFLVCYNKEIVARKYPGADGTIEEIQGLQPSFALIAKEDYWNSIPNYRPILFND